MSPFFQGKTWGEKSPYNWSPDTPDTFGQSTASASTPPQNPFTPAANGCITAECAAGIGRTGGHGLLPDYATVGGSVLSGTTGAAINLHDGTTYASAGVSQMLPAPSWAPGYATTVGWIFGAQDGKATNSFMAGDGNQISISIPTPFRFNVVGGITHAYVGSTAIELGIGTPGPVSGGLTPWSHSTEIKSNEK